MEINEDQRNEKQWKAMESALPGPLSWRNSPGSNHPLDLVISTKYTQVENHDCSIRVIVFRSDFKHDFGSDFRPDFRSDFGSDFGFNFRL